MPVIWRVLFCGLLLGLLSGSFVLAQPTRLDDNRPTLAIRPNGRFGSCDVLQFTRDGKTLYAAGDDQLLHRWTVDVGTLKPLSPVTVRKYRERRGAIYAAVELQNNLLAVAGFGLDDADVSIIDLVKGQVVDGLGVEQTKSGYDVAAAVWALAYHAETDRLAIGCSDSSIWMWNRRTNTADRHPLSRVREEGVIRGLGFGPTGELWAVDGLAKLRTDKGIQPVGLVESVHNTSVSTTSGRIALVANQAQGQMAVMTVNGAAACIVSVGSDRVIESAALDPSGERLGVLSRSFELAGENVRHFGGGRLDIFQLPAALNGILTTPTATVLFGQNQPLEILPDMVAFHPKDPTLVAIAGGANHETSLWKIDGAKLRPLDVTRPVSRCIWGVSISPDGRQIAYQTQPNPQPDTNNTNLRGSGPWHTFDVLDRKPLADRQEPFQPRLETANGWKLVTLAPADDRKKAKPGTWFVYRENANGPPSPHMPLVLNEFAGAPLCYTFLPGMPTRVAIGHTYGFTTFELSLDNPPKRLLQCIGHVGRVTSLATTGDGTRMISGGQDGSIGLWHLGPWMLDGTSLGACGVSLGNETVPPVIVRRVLAGSPGWEAGLLEGDRLWAVFTNNRWVKKTNEMRDAVAESLCGEELAFEIQRVAGGKEFRVKTRQYRRPQWRFTPLNDGEWLFARYHDHLFTHSGRKAEQYFGWHQNGPTLADAPRFDPLGRFPTLHDDRAISRSLGRQFDFPKELMPPELIPPGLTVTATRTVLKDGDTVELTINVELAKKLSPKGDDRPLVKGIPLEKLEVWATLNNNPSHILFEKDLHQNVENPLKVRFEAKKLRTGKNTLMIVAHAQTPGTTTVDLTFEPKVQASGVLRGLFVGVDSSADRRPPLLAAVKDAQGLHDAFRKSVTFAGKVQLSPVLANDQASPTAILNRLQQLVNNACPEDTTVVYLAGHGDVDPKSGEWFFCTGGQDAKHPDGHLSHPELFSLLKLIPGKTVVLLDSCRSGAVKDFDVTAVRDIRPADRGPLVLTASSANQKAHEDQITRTGLFTDALIRGMGNDRKKADANGDDRLTLPELFRYVSDSLARNPVVQTPMSFPGELPDELTF